MATHGYITLSNSSHNEGVFEDFQPAFSLDGNQLTQRHSPSASLPGRLRWNSPVKPPQAWQASSLAERLGVIPYPKPGFIGENVHQVHHKGLGVIEYVTADPQKSMFTLW